MKEKSVAVIAEKDSGIPGLWPETATHWAPETLDFYAAFTKQEDGVWKVLTLHAWSVDHPTIGWTTVAVGDDYSRYVPRPPLVSNEVWSRTGLDGGWNFDSLAEMIKSDYGTDTDAPTGDGLKIGDTVFVGVKCYSDPADFVPDADDVANHMYEAASSSDAGEWADNYPDLSPEALAALQLALEPLQEWARKHAQPSFFTVEKVQHRELTAEDVWGVGVPLTNAAFESVTALIEENPLSENEALQALLVRPEPWVEGGMQ